MAGAKAFVKRLSAFMPVGSETAPAPLTVIERALDELWSRTAPPMPLSAQRKVRKGVEDLLESFLWELNNHLENRIPDPVDYVEMRRATLGSDLVMALCQLAVGDGLPLELFRSRTMSSLIHSAQDYGGMLNDIISYQKEIQFEGELNNAVLVVESFLGCDKERAVTVVNNLMTARVQQFEHILATELDALCDEFALDSAGREKVHDYIEDIQNWLASLLNWHKGSGRYKEDKLHRTPSVGRVLHGPTGLGTSAARIASQFGARTTRSPRP